MAVPFRSRHKPPAASSWIARPTDFSVALTGFGLLAVRRMPPPVVVILGSVAGTANQNCRGPEL
jgi:hypothetical protein